ncbi:MAG TPA: efflux RND transporter periplasmic adaptor subunit [Fimbriimonadaceae bacterium]|jgi:RND family efflux transporter MFP subunit
METALETEPKNPNGSAPLKKKKDSPKKWLGPAVFVVILIIAAFFWMRSRGASANSKMVTTTVSRQNLTVLVSATGSVEAQTGAQVSIGPQITGVIKKLYVDIGSHVNKGDIIASLDLPDLQANYQGAQDAEAASLAKYQQTVSGVPEERVQTSTAIDQAKAALVDDQEKLQEAKQVLYQQQTTTPTDVRKAQTALNAAVAGVKSANANLVQTQDGANLTIQTSQEQLTQAQANATNSAALLVRNTNLYNQGYIAAATLDQAKATDAANQSAVRAAQENVTLTQQKETDALETAQDTLDQAKQTQLSAQAALTAAKSETLTTAQKSQEVKEATATVQQAQAAYQTSLGNKANDVLKDQDVVQARNAWGQAQQTVLYNQAQVNKTYIRSPITGTVLNLAAQQGQTLAAGLASPNIITVADLNRLEIDAYVSETDIGKVKKGQSASVTIDAFPNQTFNGTVQKIAHGSTIQQNVVTYEVTIGIKDPNHQLNPDMTATVNIEVENLQNVIAVPSVAVQLTTSGATVNTLEVQDGNETVVPVKVTTGGTDGVNTQITSGLKEGQTVVLAGGSTKAGRAANNPLKSGSSGGGGRGGG